MVPLCEGPLNGDPVSYPLVTLYNPRTHTSELFEDGKGQNDGHIKVTLEV